MSYSSFPWAALVLAVEGFHGSGVREVNLPGSITEISKGAFEDCASLNLVEMAGQDPEIGEQAFLGCEALNTVSLVGRWALGNKAFGDCPSLERFVLEDSHDIDRDAFKGSENVVVYTDSSWATGEAAKAGVKTTSTEE